MDKFQSVFASTYLIDFFKNSITKAYEVDYIDYKKRYHSKSTHMADNPFIKDMVHKRITDALEYNNDFIIFPNKRGSGGHILVFDTKSEKLYTVIQKSRYKAISKEATDPDKPAHYVFIYSQVNPVEDNTDPNWELIPYEEEHLNELLIRKKAYAKEEAKKYLRNLKPDSFILVVYDMDESTNSISSIEAFIPSSLYLTPLKNEIENWLEHQPIFSFEDPSGMEKQNEDEQLKGIDLKQEIKRQLQERDNPSVEEKKDEKNSKEVD